MVEMFCVFVLFTTHYFYAYFANFNNGKYTYDGWNVVLTDGYFFYWLLGIESIEPRSIPIQISKRSPVHCISTKKKAVQQKMSKGKLPFDQIKNLAP